MTREGPRCGGEWLAMGSVLQEYGTSRRHGSGENVVPPLTRTALTPRPWGGTRAAGMIGVLSRIDSRAHAMALVDKPCRHSEGQSTPTARDSGLTESDSRRQWNLQMTAEKMSFINAVAWREMCSCFNVSGKKSCRASVSKKIAASDPPAVECRVSIGRSVDRDGCRGPRWLQNGSGIRRSTGGLAGSQRLRDGAKKDAGREKRRKNGLRAEAGAVFVSVFIVYG